MQTFLRTFLVVFILTLVSTAYLVAQNVNVKFDQLILSENFDSVSADWPMLADADNLFIVQDGEMIMHRKSKKSPYAVLGGFGEQSNLFRLVSSLKLDKAAGDESIIGLLFMAQSDGKGGFIVEFNKRQEYRIKQITGNKYRYLSGDDRKQGWVKSDDIKDMAHFNLVEVSAANRMYDLYINNEYQQSFTNAKYMNGKMGVIIGPSTQARVDFFYVFTSSTYTPSEYSTNQSPPIPAPAVSSSNSDDVIKLTETIIALKKKNNTLMAENEDLRRKYTALESDDQEREESHAYFKEQVKVLQQKVKKINFTNDSLKRVNNQLIKYRDIVNEGGNQDLIISLSQTVKNLKGRNSALEKTNLTLSQNVQKLQRQVKDLKAGRKPSDNDNIEPVKPANKDKNQQQGFTLPSDGSN